MPSLTQLEYIIAVDKQRHFSKAANQLNVSQPTLSAQIQKAEEELGITIFDRMKKPLEPTDKGARFIEQAKVVVKEHQKLIEFTKNDAGEMTGEFRLGIIPTLVTSLVPRIVEPFSTDFPRLKIHIDEMKTPDIIQALKDDKIDAGILATPLHEDKLKERPIFYEPFSIFCAEDHPMTKLKTISEKHLVPDDLWLLKEGHCMRAQVLALCSLENERKIFPNIQFEGGTIESLCEIVRHGRGYTLVPDLHLAMLTAEERRKQVRPLRNPIPVREVSLVHRLGDWRKQHFKLIRDTLARQIPPALLEKPSAKSEILPIDQD